MISYLSYILILVFSCTGNRNDNTKTTISEQVKTNLDFIEQDTTHKLKFTSGIRSILHDSKGNYWLGSGQEGVCLFDGTNYSYYTIDEGLSGNQVRTIQEDKNGVIWFGTSNGVSSYNSGIITDHTSKNTITGLSLTTEGEWGLSDGDLWFDAGIEAGVYRFDGVQLNFLALPISGNKEKFSVYGNTGFSKGKNGGVWLASYAAAFGYNGREFKIIDDEFLGYETDSEILHIRSILEDSNGNLWIGNNGIGVLCKTGSEITNFSKEHGLVLPRLQQMGNEKGTLEHVFAIGEDNAGNIWFGDRDTGAWKYDGTTIINYKVDGKLANQHIWEIYQDRNGELLFAMHSGGVYKFEKGSFVRKF